MICFIYENYGTVTYISNSIVHVTYNDSDNITENDILQLAITRKKKM